MPIPSCPKTSNACDIARQAIVCGAARVAFGRGAFQSGDPEAQVRALCSVVLSSCGVHATADSRGPQAVSLC